MRTLSKDAEQAIIKAATEAVELVDAGSTSPNAAVETIARREKFGAHKVRLLSHAYNTGRQTAQRESNDTALGKFASFPLVDPEHVISQIFPKTKEAFAKQASDYGISDEYRRPPQWQGTRDAQSRAVSLKSSREKAASAPKPAVPSRTGIEHVYNTHLTLKRAVEEARTKAGMAHDRLVTAMGCLADYFKQSPHVREKFASVEYAATSYHGTAGKCLMDYIYARNKMKEARANDRMPLVRADFTQAPYSLLRDCVSLATVVHNKRAAEHTANDALESHAIERLAPYVAEPKILKRAADSLIPEPDIAYYDADDVRAFLPHRLQQKVATTTDPVVSPPSLLDGLTKEAGNATNWSIGTAVGMGTRGALDKVFGSQDPASRINSTYLDLEDPAHDAQLRQIKSQAMLTDLMNDDVIGGYDPDQVARAYNEISQMAPRTAGQPIAVRGLLRQHLQSNPAPHETQQIGQIEKGLVESNVPTPESLQPVPKSNVAKPPPKTASFRIIDDAPANSIL